MKTIYFLTIISFWNLLSYSQDGFIVDHTTTDLSQIPINWIEQAKSDLHIAYNHTSHGSQLISGMNALAAFPDFENTYSWTNNSIGNTSSLSLDDNGIPGVSDLSNGDYDSDGDGIANFAEDTYTFLDNTDNYHINVILWSWCNIGGHDIPLYLDSMDWLISNFSEGGTHPRAAANPVTFVFITGHANGGGEGDSSDTPNEQIRAHVVANNYILYDFSDIENYDPDNNYFLDKRVDDALNYDNDPPYDSGSRGANWASEYLINHDNSELDQLTTGEGVPDYSGCESCAHSPESGETQDAKLNCILKGRAAWYLFARLSGWDGTLSTDSSMYESSFLTNSPNPFYESTKIQYFIKDDTWVKIGVYDASGKNIKSLVNQIEPAGLHQINFEASSLSGGIYFLKLTTDYRQITQKIILIN